MKLHPKLNLTLLILLTFGATALRSALAQTYTITDLGTLGGECISECISVGGLNNFGQVVGRSLTRQKYQLQFCFECGDPCKHEHHCYRNSYAETHAFLWTPTAPNGTNGTLMDLGTFGGPVSSATAINNVGQVVGYADTSTKLIWTEISDISCCTNSWEYYDRRSFLWTPSQANGATGSMTATIPTDFVPAGAAFTGGDPNRLNPSGSGWTLSRALYTNDSGQIVGYGSNPSGQTHPFLLTPLPAPRLTFVSTQSNGQFRFTLLGEAGRSYTIQASTNLVDWTALTNFVSATGTDQFTDPAAPSFNRRFYRAVTP